MFRDKSIVSHHVETHLGKKQQRSILYCYRVLPVLLINLNELQFQSPESYVNLAVIYI
jgi:hypothetical protein